MFDFVKSERESFLNMAEKLSLPTPELLYNEYHDINEALWKELEQGNIDKNTLLIKRFKQLFRIYNINETIAEKANSEYVGFLSKSVFLLEEAEDVCKTLSQNHTLWIITNGIAVNQHGRFDKAGIKQYFAGIFISEEIGYAKPHIAFFNKVIEKTGAKTTDMLVIGDSPSADIEGGNNAKIDTCYYNPKGNKTDIYCKYEIKMLTELYTIV